jgi:hypothetical protein
MSKMYEVRAQWPVVVEGLFYVVADSEEHAVSLVENGAVDPAWDDFVDTSRDQIEILEANETDDADSD